MPSTFRSPAKNFSENLSVAVIGAGPAALMAADVLSSAGLAVTVFEKRKAPGRKLLIAGSSGLNITNSLPLEKFATYYLAPHAAAPTPWLRILENWGPRQWLSFIENELGIGTFEGTSGRYFVEEMKASKLLQTWTQRLSAQGVRFEYEKELTGFESLGRDSVRLKFSAGVEKTVTTALLALGGASYEPKENPLRWISLFRASGILFHEFEPSNVGYGVAWKPEFLKEAEGKPLKNILLSRPRETLPLAPELSRRGELIITRYGLEGTPIYQLGSPGAAWLDLKPDLTEREIREKLERVRENLSPLRRVKKQLGLSEAALALLFHHAPPAAKPAAKNDLTRMASLIKKFPLHLGAPQPLTEAISSRGGVSLEEITEDCELKKAPGIFLAGEMLDWDTCTGGFLIQGCVSQGVWAAQGILRRLHSLGVSPADASRT